MKLGPFKCDMSIIVLSFDSWLMVSLLCCIFMLVFISRLTLIIYFILSNRFYQLGYCRGWGGHGGGCGG